MVRTRFIWAVSFASLLGFSTAARAADSFAPIAPAMQRFIDKQDAMGIVTLVATPEKIVHEAAVGTSDGTRKLQTNDLFWIASMSKPITAVAVAMLADEGKLRFDDPVSLYIPEFGNLEVLNPNEPGHFVPPHRAIRIRDLLTHTSGMPYNYKSTDPHWTLEQFAQQICSQPLDFQPGEYWNYSNASFDVLGLVVQKASGMPFDQFLQKRLFDPLGMKDTTFWISPANASRFVRAYAPDPETHKLKEARIMGLYGSEMGDTKRPPLGAAGLFSTGEDLARFYQMMLRVGKVGEKVILKAQTVEQMTQNQVGWLDPGYGLSWGLGFARIHNPEGLASNAMLSKGSFGHVGLFGTNSWADPERGVIYILLLERDKLDNYLDSPMRLEFQTLAAEAMEAEKARK